MGYIVREARFMMNMHEGLWSDNGGFMSSNYVLSQAEWCNGTGTSRMSLS